MKSKNDPCLLPGNNVLPSRAKRGRLLFEKPTNWISIPGV